jgi:hypothetical protein
MTDNLGRRAALLPGLSLFTSLSTLICCALPALLVTLGLGAALAGLVSAAPWLVVLSDHKKIVFAVAGILLAASAFMQWRGRNAPCPADSDQAKACARLRAVSIGILVFSMLVYATGFFFAFLAARIFY